MIRKRNCVMPDPGMAGEVGFFNRFCSGSLPLGLNTNAAATIMQADRWGCGQRADAGRQPPWEAGLGCGIRTGGGNQDALDARQQAAEKDGTGKTKHGIGKSAITASGQAKGHGHPP
jgi:hypothetical protein